MCGRVINHLDLPTLRRLARTNASRRADNISRGFNIGPTSHQAVIMHISNCKDLS